MATLREQNIHLYDGPLHLRPMAESDWDILLRWNNDPEVLYYVEDDPITSWPLADMQAMYRGVSQNAHVFVVELDGQPIGECWLQQMNLESVLRRYPGLDTRRIDLMIGEKALWGRGWGTRIIGLLTRFAFERCGADAVFGMSIGDYNPRSRRAFEKNGYRVEEIIPEPEGHKAKVHYRMILPRAEYEQRAQSPCSPG